MKVAIEGCCHGELDSIYEALRNYENQNSVKVDLLIICGDFQAVRNRIDMNAMAVPHKYREMKTFYKYYSGECIAPVLTLFVGGNHEASNYLQELPYGGWVAKNIYYMGYANVIQFGGIRIAGISGIYKKYNYNFGHHERPPYNENDIKSVYHMRNLEVFRLKQLQQPIDIIISHDWPRGIYKYGDANALLRYKKHFRMEMEAGTLGNPATEELLFTLKPTYWFAAHMHCRFQATVQHEMENGNTKFTNFLALDKCLPNRKFMEIIDVDTKNKNQELKLHLDPEWLCILKLTNQFFSIQKSNVYLPGARDSSQFSASGEILQSIREDFMNNFIVPENFVKTAAVHSNTTYYSPMLPLLNPQTQLLCSMLDIIDPFATILEASKKLPTSTFNSPNFTPSKNTSYVASNMTPRNVEANRSFNSCSIDDCFAREAFNNSDFINSTMNSCRNSTLDTTLASSNGAASSFANPDEISLDDDSSEEDERDIHSEVIGAAKNPNLYEHKFESSSMLTSSPASFACNSKMLLAENLEKEWIADAKNKSIVICSDFDDSKRDDSRAIVLDEEELAFLGPDTKKLSLSPVAPHSSRDLISMDSRARASLSIIQSSVDDADLCLTPLNRNRDKGDASLNNRLVSSGLKKRRNVNIYFDKNNQD